MYNYKLQQRDKIYKKEITFICIITYMFAYMHIYLFTGINIYAWHDNRKEIVMPIVTTRSF